MKLSEADLSMTMYGGGSGLGVSASKADSYKNEESLVNTNSNLIANNINLYVKNDATIKGATIRADDTLKMYVGGNLELISQRDELSSIQKGKSIGGEYSLGSDNKYTSGNKKGQRVLDKKVGARVGSSLGGGSTNTGNSKGTYQGKEVVLSSITGENVNIEVKGNTNLKGSLIAAGSYDEYGNFIDNNNLYLKTDTLTYSSLSSTLYSKDSSFGTGSNTGFIKFEGFKPVINGSKAIPSSMNLASSINYSKEKTLATIGSGTLIVNDEENSDELERLNRDTNNIIKDLYKGEIGTSVDASIDHRLLNDWDSIKDDVEKSKDFVDSVADLIVESSVKFGEFNNHLENKENLKDTIAEFMSAEDGKYAKALNYLIGKDPDPNNIKLDGMTTEEKVEFLKEAITLYVKTQDKYFGTTINDVVLTALSNSFFIDSKGEISQVQGFTYTNEEGTTFSIDLTTNKNVLAFAATLGHETFRVATIQGIVSDKGDENNRQYSELMGKYSSIYFENFYDKFDYGKLNTHYVQNNEFIYSPTMQQNNLWAIDKILNESENVKFRALRILQSGGVPIGTIPKPPIDISQEEIYNFSKIFVMMQPSLYFLHAYLALKDKEETPKPEVFPKDNTIDAKIPGIGEGTQEKTISVNPFPSNEKGKDDNVIGGGINGETQLPEIETIPGTEQKPGDNIYFAKEAKDIIQSGGHTLKKETAKKLNDYTGENKSPKEWGDAAEELKEENLLPNTYHGNFLRNGDYTDSEGNVIDNLIGYLR